MRARKEPRSINLFGYSLLVSDIKPGAQEHSHLGVGEGEARKESSMRYLRGVFKCKDFLHTT